MMTARIAGIGAYVPENLITNDDLAKIVDTNDEWIRTRTGIIPAMPAVFRRPSGQ